MTSERSFTHRAAMAFYEWLVARNDEVLPELPDICLALRPASRIDPYRLALAINWLAKQRMLQVQRGVRNRDRRHYLIRVVSTGRVYRTDGCPFPIPQQEAAQ